MFLGEIVLIFFYTYIIFKRRRKERLRMEERDIEIKDFKT